MAQNVLADVLQSLKGELGGAPTHGWIHLEQPPLLIVAKSIKFVRFLGCQHKVWSLCSSPLSYIVLHTSNYLYIVMSIKWVQNMRSPLWVMYSARAIWAWRFREGACWVSLWVLNKGNGVIDGVVVMHVMLVHNRRSCDWSAGYRAKTASRHKRKLSLRSCSEASELFLRR